MNSQTTAALDVAITLAAARARYAAGLRGISPMGSLSSATNPPALFEITIPSRAGKFPHGSTPRQVLVDSAWHRRRDWARRRPEFTPAGRAALQEQLTATTTAHMGRKTETMNDQITPAQPLPAAVVDAVAVLDAARARCDTAHGQLLDAAGAYALFAKAGELSAKQKLDALAAAAIELDNAHDAYAAAHSAWFAVWMAHLNPPADPSID